MSSVCSTVPLVFLTSTLSVSNWLVVLVSAVSTCSQKVSVAEVAVEGMATVCRTVSVVVVPQPSIHASKVPACGGSEAELLMMESGLCVEVSTQGEAFALPASNPGLPSNCVPPGVGVGTGVGVGVGPGVGVGVGVPPPAGESAAARAWANRTPPRASCWRTTGSALEMYVAERVVVVVVLVGIPAYAIFLAKFHACMAHASGVVCASACADAISGLRLVARVEGVALMSLTRFASHA